MKSQTLDIFPATVKDLKVLKTIGIQTFTESFASFNTPENMELYLNESFDDYFLSRELNHSDIRYYLASANNKPIGYLKLNFAGAQKELQNENGLEIERIYILKEFQNLNYGQLMFEFVLKIARDCAAKLIWLGVWEHNPGAIRFYKRNGFTEFGKHVFMLGEDKQMDLLMKLNLVNE